MCSNNSLSSSGGGSGGDNDGYGGGDSLYSKKQRRQKVPKRGPGVAELEKILREQEKRSDLSLISPISNSANSKHFTSPPPPPLGGGDNGRKVGVNIGGTGMFLPEQDLLPTTWNSTISDGNNFDGKMGSRFQFSALPLNGSTNQLFPSSSNLMQTSTQHSPPSTKNLFPNPALSSSLTTLSAGNCNGREPPSIQTSYRHPTLWPEEDKMVGEKRGRAVPMEIPPVPPFRYHIPTFSTQMNNRLDSPFSCDTRTLFNLEPTDQSISRDMRTATTSSEPNSKRSHTEHGESDVGNLLLFPSPTTPPSLIHTPNIFNPFPLQESSGDVQQVPNTQGGPSRKKPFYSFLPPREKLGMAESLNTERVETKGDGIDLELRL